MSESTQKIISRVRKPRVHITYDVEVGDAIEKKELPFVIGILADLAGDPVIPLPKIKERKFVEIDRDNINDILSWLSPRLHFSVENVIPEFASIVVSSVGNGDSSPASDASQPAAGDPQQAYDASSSTDSTVRSMSVELYFKHMSDFSPFNVSQHVPEVFVVFQKRARLHDLLIKCDGNDDLQHALLRVIVEDGALDACKTQLSGFSSISSLNENDMLYILLKAAKSLENDEQAKAINVMISEFVLYVESKQLKSARNIISLLESMIAEYDKILSAQINLIMHHTAFQELEAQWRGLFYLVTNTETGAHLKLRVLYASKKELTDDLEKAIEFDQSALFKKVYEEEYGTFGGAPFSCLVLGHYIDRSALDMILLEKLAGVAAAAHTPAIVSAHPKLFDMETYESLANPRDLSKIFESTEMVKWRSFRESEDSRYVALTLPRVLARLPYGPDTIPVEEFAFVENIDCTHNKDFCWSSAAYVFGQRIGNAVAHYGWPAAIRGVEGGGLVEGLPAYSFRTASGDSVLKCPTEVAITDRREKELSDMGFLALCHCKGTDKAAFFGGQTVQKPRVYNTDEANANAALSARLPYLLSASRFAHYIKAIMRDKIGAFSNAQEVYHYLSNWIGGYVVLNDSSSHMIKAKYPLREARVDVFDIPGKPGSYTATIFLRPHFQLEELTASIRLVAKLPAPAQ